MYCCYGEVLERDGYVNAAEHSGLDCENCARVNEYLHSPKPLDCSYKLCICLGLHHGYF